MERSQRKLFLLLVCLIVPAIGYAISSHKSSKKRASSEMKQGVKAITKPDALVKDLLDD